jgi:hypothetical protein
MKGTPAVSRGWCTGCNGPSGPETNDHCRAVRAQRGRYCAHQKSLLRVKTLDRLLAALLAVVLVGAGPSVQAQPDALSVQGVTITGTDLDRTVPPGPLGHIQVFGTSNATQLSTEAPRFAPHGPPPTSTTSTSWTATPSQQFGRDPAFAIVANALRVGDHLRDRFGA